MQARISNQISTFHIAMKLLDLLGSDMGMAITDELYITTWARAYLLVNELIDQNGPEHFTDEEEEYIIESRAILRQIGEEIHGQENMDGA